MKIRTRVARLAVAIFAALTAVFVATPAHAAGGGDLDTLEPFRHIGEPQNWMAIGIVMAVLLVVVLLLAQLISGLFSDK